MARVTENLASPSGIDAVLLAIALAGVSFSGPLMAATAAPALAIAFWRNGIGALVAASAAALRNRAEIGALDRRAVRTSMLAGVALALHFGCWVPSLTMTSVASATALVCAQPVFAGLIAAFLGRRLPTLAWLGIGVATVGAGSVAGADFALSTRALAGDALALAGGLFAAVYVTIGAGVRERMSTTVYTAICYSTCAVLLLGTCLIAGVELGGYSGDAWLKIAAVTVCAQLLGHSLINVVLRSTSATVVSLAILLETPGAALIALVWLGQTPPASTIPGLVLLLAGLAVVVAARGRAQPVEAVD